MSTRGAGPALTDCSRMAAWQQWGAMLADGRQVLAVAPHVCTVPGLAIFLLTLGFNVLGDALHDALDPRLRH